MKRSYTPCEKHELIGCITCKSPRVATQYDRAEEFTLWHDLYEKSDFNNPICTYCGYELERRDQVAVNHGYLMVHQFCWTDRGEPSFHTFDNPSTQRSQHAVDPKFTRINPSPLDRGWEKEE